MDKLTRRKIAAARAREGIPMSLILERLAGHLQGEVDLQPTQIRAAEILLKKCMPDLAAVDYTGDVTHRTVSELSREELERIAAGGSEGIAAPDDGDGDAASLH